MKDQPKRIYLSGEWHAEDMNELESMFRRVFEIVNNPKGLSGTIHGEGISCRFRIAPQTSVNEVEDEMGDGDD